MTATAPRRLLDAEAKPALRVLAVAAAASAALVVALASLATRL